MLLLYKNITPNYSKTHYYFKDFAKFLNFLQPNKVTEIEDKRYSLFNGFIRIAIDNVITDLNYSEITYIIDTHDNICYHVSAVQLHTTFVIYTVTQDLWGSYIYKAKLDNINILRCNRKISENGIYDTIDNSDNLLRFIRVPFIDEDNNVISHDTFNNWFILIYVIRNTLTIPLVMNLQDVINVIGFYGELNISMILSGISQINLEEGRYADAKFIKGYLIHKAFVNEFSSSRHTYIKTNYSGEKIINAIRVSTLTKYLKLQFNNTNLNCKTYIGTYNYSLPVRHFIKDEELESQVVVCCGVDKLNIFLVHNADLHDITQSFEIPATDYGSNIRSTDGISSAIGYLRGAIQLGVGIFGGSPLSIVKGISSISGQSVKDMTKPHSSLVGSGDFAVNIDNTNNGLYTPFKLFHNISLKDEYKHARKLGANFNEYIDELDNVFTFDLIGTGLDTDDTYLQCNTGISNVPTNAIDIIESKLKEGIYLQYLN